jgi:hypothetical protein
MEKFRNMDDDNNEKNMWVFADNHTAAFVGLAVATLLVCQSALVNFAHAFQAWGTKHCGSCACRAEEHGDTDEKPFE